MGADLNTFITALGDVFREDVLGEKLVVAPSRRVAFQWLDAVARSGQPVFNARAETLKGLAMSLASAALDSGGLRLASEIQLEVLADSIIAAMVTAGGARAGYLSALAPSAGLTRIVSGALKELRLAGLDAAGLDAGAFEVERKGHEVAEMLASFERLLAERGLTDYPGLLAMAAGLVEKDPSALAGRVVLVPENLYSDMGVLERAFLDLMPEGSLRVLPVDRAGETPKGVPESELTDAMLLRWTADPAAAPPPKGDGTVSVLSAVGEVNEVREVFRWCVERGVPLDRVEVLYTQTDTYVPLFYEIATRMMPGDTDELPVTFAEGIPAMYSRPGKALAAWLSWIDEGYPQQQLVRMVRDGLLEVPSHGSGGLTFSRLAAVLRTVPIGAGADRYVPGLRRAASSLERMLEGTEVEDGDGEDDGHHLSEEKAGNLATRLAALEALTGLVEALAADIPADAADGRAWLERARRFLERTARSENRHDAYSAERLIERIAELDRCLEQGGPRCFDVKSWLSALPGSERVGGRGPGPGCIHVANLQGGGHSGRPHTFIVGMDDTRFPGAGLQDPLLLDGERSRLSDGLATAAGRVDDRVRAFAGTVARLRGDVTLSYCSRSLRDDREMFPSRVLISVRRVLEGRAVTALALEEPPASFAPSEAARCMDMTEWWLWRTCAAGPVDGISGVIGRHFPNLARGMSAALARAGDSFTEYDGYVPAAGPACDCAAAGGPVLSPSRLETFARCPLEYFFAYVLQVTPPEEYQIDTGRWLDPRDRGSLLHAVFCDFLRELDAEGLLPPDFERDRRRLELLVDRYVDDKRIEKPPPGDPGVFLSERDGIRRTAEVFLQMEEAFCSGHVPVACELAIGVGREGAGTDFDIAEPYELLLPDGRCVRVRCKVDRVDRVLGREGNYVVCDYKTGASGTYHSRGPFHMGRFMQGALYPALAEHALGEALGTPVRVVRFDYVFPNPQEARRVSWETRELSDGLGLVALICDMMASGCFPFTDDKDDLKFSDYTLAFGDVAASLAAARRKLENSANTVLEPYRILRGLADPREEVVDDA